MHVLGLTMFLLVGVLLTVVVVVRSRIDSGQRERRILRHAGTEIWEWFARFERVGGRVQDLEGLSWGDSIRARRFLWLAAGQLIVLMLLTAVIYVLGWPWWIAQSATVLIVVVGGYVGEIRVFFADYTAETWRYQNFRGTLVFGLAVKAVMLALGLGLVALSADLVERGSVLLALPIAASAVILIDRCHVPARWIESVLRRRQSIDFAEGATGDTILYLRSFDDDKSVIFAPVASTRWYAPLVPQRVRFEELVEAWTFREASQVIAIGRPGERRPSLGAERSYWTDETWQEAVRRTAARCKAVIVVAGTTEGLSWEISVLAEMGVLGKTLLLLPPDTTEKTAQRYRRITAASNREHDALVDDQLALSAIPAMGYTADGDLVHYVSFGRDWAAYVMAETHLLRTLSGQQQFDEAGNLTRLHEITDDPVTQAFALSIRMGLPAEGRRLLDDLLADGSTLTGADYERVAIARAAAILAERDDVDLALASLPITSGSPVLADARRALSGSNPSAEEIYRFVLPTELREVRAQERHETAPAIVSMRLMALWSRASELEDKARNEGFLDKARAASALAEANGLDLARAMSDVMVAQALHALSRNREAETLVRRVLTRELPVDGTYAKNTFRVSDVHDGADSVLLDVIDRSTPDGRRACIRVLEAQYERRRAQKRRSEAAESARDLALWGVEEGDIATADRWGDVAFREFAALGNSRDQAQTLTTLARASLGAKEYEAALARAESALALIDANLFTELKSDAMYAFALAADGIAQREPSADHEDDAIRAIRAILAFDLEAETENMSREEGLLGRLVARLRAREHYGEAVDAQRRLAQLHGARLGADDPRTLSERLQLARLVRDSGDSVEAEAQVHDLARVTDSIDITRLPGLKEEILLTQAGFAESAGDIDHAVALLDTREASIALRAGPDAALWERYLAIGVLADAKRNAEALQRQQFLLEELGAMVGVESPKIGEAVERRNELEWRLSWGEARALEDGGDFAAAAARHETWLRHRSLGGARDAERTAHSSAARGRCVSLAGQPEEGQRILSDAHTRAITDLGRTHAATRWFLTETARTYRRIGDYAAEVTVLEELYGDEVAAVGEDDREAILTTGDLALAHDQVGRGREARQFAELTVAKATLAFGADDPFTQRRRDRLIHLLADTDEHADRPPAL